MNTLGIFNKFHKTALAVVSLYIEIPKVESLKEKKFEILESIKGNNLVANLSS